jgi:hypothetical protein
LKFFCAVAQRLLVVGVGVTRQRKLVGDHPEVHGLAIALGKILLYDAPHLGDLAPPLGGQLVEILLHRLRLALGHACSPFE